MPFLMLVVGGRNTGKSFTTSKILQKSKLNKSYYRYFMISISYQSNKKYWNYLDINGAYILDNNDIKIFD